VRGGGRPAPSGGSPEVSQRWPPGHHFAWEDHQKKEEGTRTLPGGLERWERRRRRRSTARGGRRSSGSGEAPGSARTGEERGESGVGGIGGGARLLYRVEGQAEGRRGGGRRAHRRPPLRPDGGLGARPFPGEEEAGTAPE
jgi:hypothetical protein